MKLYAPIRGFDFVLGALLIISLLVYNLDSVVSRVVNGFSNNQVEEVYDNLYIHSGLGQKPPLTILESSDINAWTDGKEVVITAGMLQIMGSIDEVAMVLGHELGHVINYDIPHGAMEFLLDMPIDGRYKEASADKIGAFIMMRAGYDICKGKKIMTTFKERFGSDAGSRSHPDNSFRVDELDLPQCHSVF